MNAVPIQDDEAENWVVPTWEDVVREHGDRVYRLAYRLAGNQHDAEDITQETFIRVFKSLANYQPGTFEGWLHRITTNLFLDMVRRRSRLRMEGLPDDDDRLAGDDPSPEEIYSQTRTSTRTSRRPWTSWRRSSAPRSCCVTWKACPTRRSAPRSA